MRAYLVVVLIIAGLMGGYLALAPEAHWSDANTAIAGAGPF